MKSRVYRVVVYAVDEAQHRRRVDAVWLKARDEDEARSQAIERLWKDEMDSLYVPEAEVLTCRRKGDYERDR
jgi:hypothetical protein